MTNVISSLSSKVHLLSDLQQSHPCLYNPENVAMLQALQSRSHKSVLDLVSSIESKGSEGFIQQYVIGYGHDSIADCGHTVVFFEGVSILGAMALQDFPLYAGIESSTRYMDFQNKSIVVPPEIQSTLGEFGEESLAQLHSLCLDNYKDMTELLMSEYQSSFPQHSAQAIKSKVFDIARGFLPAGIQTNVSLAGSLGKIKDWLIELTFYPLQEVRDFCNEALTRLSVCFTATYSDIEARKERLSEYIQEVNHLRLLGLTWRRGCVYLKRQTASMTFTCLMVRFMCLTQRIRKLSVARSANGYSTRKTSVGLALCLTLRS
jgi:thymidylate synthase ThyX